MYSGKKNEEKFFLEIYLSIIENEKKKLLCKIVLGYCPNDIVKKYFVLQESGLYCRDLGLNSLNCIAGIV